MNIDKWGEVTNGDSTFEWIATRLKREGSCVIGWTDEEGSHLDLLFVLTPTQVGLLQAGLSGKTDLFVSIMRRGAFGFEAKGAPIFSSYFAEKLNMGDNVTTGRLTTLINGIRAQL